MHTYIHITMIFLLVLLQDNSLPMAPMGVTEDNNNNNNSQDIRPDLSARDLKDLTSTSTTSYPELQR